MSEVIDDKIVSLTLDQEKFERNVERALQSLDELKEGLKFEGLTNSLSSIEKTIAPIATSAGKSIDYIASRFSFLGLAATKIKDTILNGIGGSIKKIFGFTEAGIKTGGLNRALNLEQAKFQLDGLGIAWDKIEKDINYGVQETAYGLDAAAKAASQLTASGVEFGDTFGDVGNSPMAKALRGISGVAAMTGATYEEISHIFTAVAGEGKATNARIDQIGGRGLNARKAIADYLHTTEEDVRDLAAKGKISFAEFSEAMDTAFGPQAKKANDTYAGSLSNVKAALARIGAVVQGTYLEKMRDIFNALIPVINKLKTALEPFLNLINKIITVVADKVIVLIEAAGKGLSYLTNPISSLNEEITKTEKKLKDFSYVEEMALKVWRGDYGNGQARIDKLREEGYCYEAIQNRVNELLKCQVRHEYEMYEEVEATEEVVKANAEAQRQYYKLIEVLNLFKRIGGALKMSFSSLKSAVTTVGKAFKKAFDKTSFWSIAKGFEQLIDSFRQFTSGLRFAENSRTFWAWQDSLTGILSVAKLLVNTILFLGRVFVTLLGPVIDVARLVLEVTGVLGALAKRLDKAVDKSEIFNKTILALRTALFPIRKAIQGATEALSKFVHENRIVAQIAKTIPVIFKAIFNVFKKVAAVVKVVYLVIKSVAIALVGAFTTIYQKIQQFINFVKGITIVQTVFTAILNAVVSVKNKIVSFVNSIVDKFKEFKEAIASLDKSKLTKVVQTFNKAKKKVADFVTGIVTFVKESEAAQRVINGFKTAMEFLSHVLEIVTAAVSKFIDKIKETAQKVVDFIKSHVTLKSVLTTISNTFLLIVQIMGKVIRKVSEFIKSLWELPIVQEMIEKIKDVIIDLAERAKPFLEEAKEKLTELMEKLSSADASNFESLVQNVNEKLGLFVQYIKTAWDFISKFFTAGDKLKQVGDQFERIKSTFETFKDGSFFKDLFKNKSAVSRTLGFGNVESGFMDLVQKIADGIKKIDPGQILALSMGFGATSAVMQFAKVEKSFSGILTSFTGLIDGASGTVKNFGNIANAISGGVTKVSDGLAKMFEPKKEAFSTTMLKMAGAIAILAGSLFLLSKVPKDQLDNAIKAIGELVTIFAGLMAVSTALASKGNKHGEVEGIGKALLMLVGSLFLLVLALKMMEALNPENLMTRVGVLVGLILTMAFVAGALGKFAPQLSKGGLSLLFFAASVALLARTLVYLSNAKMDDIKKGIKGMTAIVGLMLIYSLVARQIKFTSGLGLLAMAASMILLSKALTYIAKDFDPRLIIQNIENFILILGLMLSMALVARAAGKGAAKGALGIILIAMGMMMLIQVIKMIAKVKPEDLVKGLAVITALSVIMGALMIVSSKSNGINTKGLLVFVVAIVLLVAELLILTEIDWRKLLKATLSLGSIMLAFGGALAMAGSGKMGKDRIKAMITMIVAVGVITAALYVLSLIPWQNLLAATVALSVTMLALGATFKIIASVSGDKRIRSRLVSFLILIPMLAAVAGALIAMSMFGGSPTQMIASATAIGITIAALAGVFYLISKQNYSKNTVKKMGAFLLATLALVPVTAALVALSRYGGDPVSMIAAAVAMSVVIVTMAACFRLIAKAKPNLPSIALFLLATTSVLLIAASLWLLADQPWDGLLAAAGSITLVLVALTGVIAVLSVIGPAANGAYAGIVALDFLIIDLAAIITALGYLLGSPEAIALLNGGIQIMELLGEGIGSFVGGIVAGIGRAITSSLPGMAQELSQFAMNLIPFMVTMQMIDQDVLNGTLMLVDIVTSLSSATLWDGITSFLTGGDGISKLGTNLVEFGGYIADYSKTIEGVSSNAVLASANAGKALVEMANAIPNEGGLLSKITGDNSLTKFAEELTDFAPAFKDYAAEMEGVNPDVVKASSAAAQTVADFARKVPNEGGALAKLMGDNTLSMFADELNAFGEPFADYSKKMEGVNPDVVKASSAAAESVAEFANKIPNEGGWLSVIAGDNTLARFANEMGVFAVRFKYYSDIMAGVNTDVVTATSSAMQTITAFADTIPNEGGWLATITGDNSLASFGSELTSFGTNFAAYAETVGGIDPAIVGVSLACAQSLLAFKELVEGSDSDKTWWQKLTSGNELAGFGQQVSSFGQHIGTFYESIKGVVSSRINSIVDLINGLKSINPNDGDQLSSFSDGLAKLGTEGLVTFLDAFTTSGDKVKTAIETLFKQILAAIKIKALQLQNEGKRASLAFVSGLKAHLAQASSVGASYANAFANGLSGGAASFAQIGSNSAAGYVNGLTSASSITAAYNAGRALGDASKKGTQDSTNQASPSKEFYKFGRFDVLGYVNGITNNLGLVEEAGEEMGLKSMSAFNTAVSMIADAIDSDLDMDPTIRPVVDLTNVTAGANQINAMFSRTRALSVAGTFRTNGASIVDGEGAPTQNFNFTQNNYSPKALSRLEIYRQTKNQFAQMKGAVSQA